jgi:hypothetical protein
MACVVPLFVITMIVVIIVVNAANSRKAMQRNAFALNPVDAGGIPARALVLGCSQYSNGSVNVGTTRYERRNMVIDVEIAGRQPYVLTGEFLVPRGAVEVIPGASLDVAVDPTDGSKISVVGPGGFGGPWIRIGPPQPY